MPHRISYLVLLPILAATASWSKPDGAPSTHSDYRPASIAPSAIGASRSASVQDPKVWDNYDFVPGSKVMFYTDFADDRTGNFSRRLRYRSGAMDVVERDGIKVLRVTSRSEFLIPVGRKLPERFTLEIDVIAPPSGKIDMVSFEGGRDLDRGPQSANVTWNPGGLFILGSGQDQANSPVKIPDAMQPSLINKVAHLRVLMDGAYFKMYVNERRVYNIPELAFRRDSVIRVLTTGAEDGEVFFTSIRVAESETDVMYDALSANGRWVTQGILFETGKADLKPESTPVLKEIAATLKDHADLKILIEGHTDNVGSATSNLTLSEARAAAVKTALVSRFGADAARITTQGLGDTKPAVPNTTAEGRAQNRRVEIVRQ
jgi:outer membrane protein OmpA-like peptidoglycan-associated protein